MTAAYDPALCERLVKYARRFMPADISKENLAAMADQLEAARAEIARLHPSRPPAPIPGYEPCRDCRYWLGLVTEACTAHRASDQIRDITAERDSLRAEVETLRDQAYRAIVDLDARRDSEREGLEANARRWQERFLVTERDSVRLSEELDIKRAEIDRLTQRGTSAALVSAKRENQEKHTITDSCPTCDQPLATASNDDFRSRCSSPFTVGHCFGDVVDWRARALTAEAKLAGPSVDALLSPDKLANSARDVAEANLVLEQQDRDRQRDVPGVPMPRAPHAPANNRPMKHQTLRDCESVLKSQYPGHAQAQDGEIWPCPCGRRFSHVCDEADGCRWDLVS